MYQTCQRRPASEALSRGRCSVLRKNKFPKLFMSFSSAAGVPRRGPDCVFITSVSVHRGSGSCSRLRIYHRRHLNRYCTLSAWLTWKIHDTFSPDLNRKCAYFCDQSLCPLWRTKKISRQEIKSILSFVFCFFLTWWGLQAPLHRHFRWKKLSLVAYGLCPVVVVTVTEITEAWKIKQTTVTRSKSITYTHLTFWHAPCEQASAALSATKTMCTRW